MAKQYEVMIKRTVEAGSPQEAIRAFWMEIDRELDKPNSITTFVPEVFEIVDVEAPQNPA